MDLRLLAGVFCGSALTLAVVAFGDAPRPQSSCTMQADRNFKPSVRTKPAHHTHTLLPLD
jgi:hypothetical protein